MNDMCTPREISRLVPMPHLLNALCIQDNERTRRAPCILHNGRNPSAFAWRDNGVWRCFSCGRGGDRIELIKAARGCGFAEALRFLADVAGVKLRGGAANRSELVRVRRANDRLDRAVQKLSGLERTSRFALASEIRRWEELRENASSRLAALRSGA